RSLRRLPEILDGLVPDLGRLVVEADGERFDLGVLWSRDFERLGDAQMQQLAARGEEATRHDFPNPVVSEVEALAPTLKESAAHTCSARRASAPSSLSLASARTSASVSGRDRGRSASVARRPSRCRSSIACRNVGASLISSSRAVTKIIAGRSTN